MNITKKTALALNGERKDYYEAKVNELKGFTRRSQSEFFLSAHVESEIAMMAIILGLPTSPSRSVVVDSIIEATLGKGRKTKEKNLYVVIDAGILDTGMGMDVDAITQTVIADSEEEAVKEYLEGTEFESVEHATENGRLIQVHVVSMVDIKTLLGGL